MSSLKGTKRWWRVPGMTGKKHSEKSKRMISLSRKGKGHPITEETKRKISLAHFGKKHSEESKKKISLARLGKKNHKHSQYLMGKKQPMETRFKRSLSLRGEKAPNWQGGKTELNQIIRSSLEYRLWRESVFKRDDYICQECGIKSGNGSAVTLNADHIKPFSLYPELRFAIDNGRTLCVGCHKKTPTFAGKLKTKQLTF